MVPSSALKKSEGFMPRAATMRALKFRNPTKKPSHEGFFHSKQGISKVASVAYSLETW